MFEMGQDSQKWVDEPIFKGLKSQPRSCVRSACRTATLGCLFALLLSLASALPELTVAGSPQASGKPHTDFDYTNQKLEVTNGGLKISKQLFVDPRDLQGNPDFISRAYLAADFQSKSSNQFEMVQKLLAKGSKVSQDSSQSFDQQATTETLAI